MVIGFKNPRTARVREIKFGWSWTCFLFSFSGVPLFKRGLVGLGLLTLGLTLGTVISVVVWAAAFQPTPFQPDPPANYPGAVLNITNFVMAFVLGSNGNRWSAKKLLKEGWEVQQAESVDVQASLRVWKLGTLA